MADVLEAVAVEVVPELVKACKSGNKTGGGVVATGGGVPTAAAGATLGSVFGGTLVPLPGGIAVMLLAEPLLAPPTTGTGATRRPGSGETGAKEVPGMVVGGAEVAPPLPRIGPTSAAALPTGPWASGGDVEVGFAPLQTAVSLGV